MTDVDHSTCKASLELLREYLEGELSPEVREKLEAHLGGCTPCEDFVRSYRATPELCRRALDANDVPDEVAESLTAFLRRELGRGR